jgi:uncharacterized caspase-like protein
MRRFFVLHPIGLLIVAVFGTALCASVRAQQQDASQHPQDFSAAYLKADTACKVLWANHAFDPLRDKIPLGGQKPTSAMLTNGARLLPKDRPLADLAIKTLEKCRALYADANAMLPQQTRLRLQGFNREQDSLIARLYSAKITIGEYNVGMNNLVAEMFKSVYGDVRPATPGASQKRLPTVPNTQPSSAPKQTQAVQSAVFHQTRVALVIGNSNYKSLPKLANPANDAREIVDALRDLGFNVTLVTDASELNIRRAVRKFADQSGQADLALVYYAGHGAQVNGENYLLPVDMEIPRTEADIELFSMKVDDLVNSIPSSTKIIFLDACRDNPALLKNLVKGRGATATGLAPTNASHLTRVKPGGGVFIAYATDAGSVALEGEGDHSPFTQALLRNVKKPLSIDDMFSLVTREVALVTKGRQRPYKYASLENIVCLTGTCSTTMQAPASDIAQEARRSESEELQIALKTNSPDALQSYLERYPASSAKQKVKEEIAHLRRSAFNEWTLFQISDGQFPHYLKVSSIRQLGDRVAVQIRTPVNPTMLQTTNYPKGSVSEDTVVYDCKQSLQGISELRVVAPSPTVLFHHKLADPEALDMSKGIVIPPGSIAATAKNILCEEKLRTPLVTKRQLATLNSVDVTEEEAESINFFEWQRNDYIRMYYQPIHNEETLQSEREAIVVMIPQVELKIADELKWGLSLELGTFKTAVYWERFRCDENTLLLLKNELFDASNELKWISATDLSQQLPWAEFNEAAPGGNLRRILCGAREVQK